MYIVGNFGVGKNSILYGYDISTNWYYVGTSSVDFMRKIIDIDGIKINMLIRKISPCLFKY